MKKPTRDSSNFIDGSLKRRFVCLRRFAKTAYFPHELKRSIPNLFLGNGWIEIEENLDVSAHEQSPQDVRTLDLRPQKTVLSYLGNDGEHAPRIASSTILQGVPSRKSKNVSLGTTYCTSVVSSQLFSPTAWE